MLRLLSFIFRTFNNIVVGWALINLVRGRRPVDALAEGGRAGMIFLYIVFILFIVALFFAFTAVIGGGAILYEQVNPAVAAVALKDIRGAATFMGWLAAGGFAVGGTVMFGVASLEAYPGEAGGRTAGHALIGFVVGAALYFGLSSAIFWVAMHENIETAKRVVAEQKFAEEQHRQAQARATSERQEAEEHRQFLQRSALVFLEDGAFRKVNSENVDGRQREVDAKAWQHFRSGDFEAAERSGSSEVSCKIGVAAKLGLGWASKFSGSQPRDTVTTCLDAARKGLPLALTQLAWLFDKGIYFDVRPDAARRLSLLAAQNGDGEATALLAVQAHGKGSLAEALQLFLKGAELGNAAAANQAAYMLTRGQGAPPDAKKGADLAQNAIKIAIPGKDDVSASEAYMLLGDAYRKGDGRPQNFDQAIAHFQMAAKLGHQQANDFLKAATEGKQQADAERLRKANEEAAAFGQRQRDEQRVEAYRRGEAAMQGVVFATNRRNLFPATDAQDLIPVEQKALEMSPGQQVGWTGSSNKSTGTIQVTREGRNDRGAPCKEFLVSISTLYSGREEPEVFCKVDGIWSGGQGQRITSEINTR